VNKIILALDTTNIEETLSTVKKIKNKIFTVKLGLEFFNAHGKNGIKKFNEIGITNLMLDLKLKDIPETVYKSIKALDDINFSFLTIHGQGGKLMIDKAKKAAKEIKSQPKIMMVTILTSLNDNDQKIIGSNNTVSQQVKKLAELAKETHIGVICSGLEAKTVRTIIGPDLLIFTPGIRMPKNHKNDQERVCTPTESIKNGANKIIMGRGLIEGNIEENIEHVSNSLNF
jgi:orotidine-5'-phosphate decarboxylase